jgi:hypothetical protein
VAAPVQTAAPRDSAKHGARLTTKDGKDRAIAALKA